MKISNQLIYCIALLIFPAVVYSQTAITHCGYEDVKQQFREQDESYFDKEDDVEIDYINFANTFASINLLDSAMLPVVVHVVHLPGTPLGTEENISDEDVRLGLERLNKL